jgi:hypothetical protein
MSTDPISREEVREKLGLGRDPARIRPFLDVLATLWEMYPDLRFAQLLTLVNWPNPDRDTFYDEEAVWLERIHQAIGEEMLLRAMFK